MANITEFILLPLAEESANDNEGSSIVENIINPWLASQVISTFKLITEGNLGFFNSAIYVTAWKHCPLPEKEIVDFIFSQKWMNVEGLTLLVDSDYFPEVTWNVFKVDNYKELSSKLWNNYD
jgi:hypothetical protein